VGGCGCGVCPRGPPPPPPPPKPPIPNPQSPIFNLDFLYNKNNIIKLINKIIK